MPDKVREQVSTTRWNEEYERIRVLCAKRAVIFGIWDGSNKLSWACHRLLKEYEGHTNRDERYVTMIEGMAATADDKVHQLDPVIARLDAEIDQRMLWLNEHEGVA